MQSNLSLEGGLSPLDLIIMVGVLLAVTWLGHSRAGKQRGLSDFFLGGRRLPWWAVSASIVATEISAVTFVSLPSVVARDGGNLTYLQIGLFGSLVARAIVGFVLLPAYYEQQIYSPYDYVARKLGPSSRRVTTALFSLGGILGQSARVYLTAVVVEVVLHAELVQVQAVTGIAPFPFAVGSICVVSIIWTRWEASPPWSGLTQCSSVCFSWALARPFGSSESNSAAVGAAPCKRLVKQASCS